MENKDVRRKRLAELEKQYGTLEKLAEATGTKAAHLSQIKNRTRGMGDKVARRIEAQLGKNPGWMDQMDERPTPAQSPIGKCSKLVQLAGYWEYLSPETKDEMLRTAETEAAPRIKAAVALWEQMKVKGFASDQTVAEALTSGHKAKTK